jgi:general secretion pathway protein C
MAARWSAWLVWVAVACAVVFWGLRLVAHGPGVPAQARWMATDQVARGDMAKLFAQASTAAPAAAPASSRYKLVGVMASPTSGSLGWVVLAVDDQPPRALKIGAAVDANLVVQSVTARQVLLGPQGQAATVTLEVPELAAAARGNLPANAAQPGVMISPDSAVAGVQAPTGVGVPSAPPQAVNLSPLPVDPSSQMSSPGNNERDR